MNYEVDGVSESGNMIDGKEIQMLEVVKTRAKDKRCSWRFSGEVQHYSHKKGC